MTKSVMSPVFIYDSMMITQPIVIFMKTGLGLILGMGMFALNESTLPGFTLDALIILI